MLSLSYLLLLGCALLQLASASEPLPPSKDPFYTAPPNYELAAPGTILRIRTAPGNLTRVVTNTSSAYNILFRTTDSQYKPAWAVTTLFVPLSFPQNTSNNGSQPGDALLSFQAPYDSANVDESPSYTLYNYVYPDIPAALSRGWYVSVPDFEGPLASFGAGVISGHATLDSVRAVLSSGFGLSTNARYALSGYSGGALASEWAAELQVQYAPELKFGGAALGGLTPNITNVLLSIEGKLQAGLIPETVIGLATQYPAVYQFIESKLKPMGPFYNETTFLAVRNLTFDQALGELAFKNITDFFVDGIADLLTPLVQKASNRDGQMGYHGTPQFPLFAYKAIGDEVSPIADTDALVARYCGIGANILYERNTVGTHETEEVNGRPRVIAFLEAVFNGTYDNSLTTGCTVQNITYTASSS